jgi:hypothetical protein
VPTALGLLEVTWRPPRSFGPAPGITISRSFSYFLKRYRNPPPGTGRLLLATIRLLPPSPNKLEKFFSSSVQKTHPIRHIYPNCLHDLCPICTVHVSAQTVYRTSAPTVSRTSAPTIYGTSTRMLTFSTLTTGPLPQLAIVSVP